MACVGQKISLFTNRIRTCKSVGSFNNLKFIFLVNSVEFLALLGFTTAHTCTRTDICNTHTHPQTFAFFVKRNNRTVQKNVFGFNQKFVRKVLYKNSPDVHHLQRII